MVTGNKDKASSTTTPNPTSGVTVLTDMLKLSAGVRMHAVQINSCVKAEWFSEEQSLLSFVFASLYQSELLQDGKNA